MTDYVILNTPGDGNYTVPTTGNYTIQAIGAGVGGTVAGFFPPKGGAGGAFAEKTTQAWTEGDIIPWHVGLGYISPNGINQGQGEPSWMGSATAGLSVVFAEGANAYTAGSTGGSHGDIKYAGGDSGHPAINGKGPGGGGAGGPNGAGAAGTATDGGAGDGGDVAGGTGGSDGASGTNMGDGTVGPGGGGSPGTPGGSGGRYGAGGAGRGSAGAGGLPGNGLIVIAIPTSPPPPPPPPPAPFILGRVGAIRWGQ